MTNYSVGDVYEVEMAYQEGDGRSKNRPVVIIDIDAKGTPIVLTVAQLTGQPPKNPPGYYDQFKLPLADWSQAGLKKPSYVKTHIGNIVQIDPSALQKRRGSLSPKDLQDLFTHLQ